MPHGGTAAASEFNAADLWEKYGITTHLGGIRATHRLAENCDIRPGQRVLNPGCGTGHSACLLAREYGAQVVAADISARVLGFARARITKAGLNARVMTLQADIHALDFPASTFDAVFVESVLIFCDKARAAAETFRVLKPGGVLGANEFTYLKPPPARWQSLFDGNAFGVHLEPLTAEGWEAVFAGVGFTEVSGELYRLRLSEQLASQIRAFGWRKYLTAVVRGLADPGVRAAFFNSDMLRMWREYPEFVGYGLYTCRKPTSPSLPA